MRAKADFEMMMACLLAAKQRRLTRAMVGWLTEKRGRCAYFERAMA